jgi:hypothetical protein
MFTVPVYVAAGNCGTPVVLMFQVRVVVVLLDLLAFVIATLPICTPVAAAGVTKAGTPAPPLIDVFSAPPALPEPAAAAVTALAGMLSAAPSVKAAAPFATHAQTVTLVRPGVITHDVWIVLVVLPGLAAVLGARLKVTAAPPVTFTVSDSPIVAVRVTVPAVELNWAFAAGGILVASAMPAAITSNLRKFFMKPPLSNLRGAILSAFQTALRVPIIWFSFAHSRFSVSK